MEYRQLAEHFLKRLERQRISVENTRELVQALEYDKLALQTAPARERQRGRSGGREDRLLDLLSRQTQLQYAEKAARGQVRAVERALSLLPQEQRRVLDRFYICPVENKLEVLSEELSLERSAIYSLRNEALKSFTLALCGLLEG